MRSLCVGRTRQLRNVTHLIIFSQTIRFWSSSPYRFSVFGRCDRHRRRIHRDTSILGLLVCPLYRVSENGIIVPPTWKTFSFPISVSSVLYTLRNIPALGRVPPRARVNVIGEYLFAFFRRQRARKKTIKKRARPLFVHR